MLKTKTKELKSKQKYFWLASSLKHAKKIYNKKLSFCAKGVN